MSRNYKFRNPEGIYFVSFTTVYWTSVFIRDLYCNLLIDQLKYCQKEKGMNLFAYCIMPNHIHLVFQSRHGKPSDLLRDYKKYTARILIKSIRNNPKESRKTWLLWMFKHAASKDTRKTIHKFWQYHSHPIELWSKRIINQKVNYIHNNPVKAGYVEKPYCWKYSSARNYMLDDSTIIKVDLI